MIYTFSSGAKSLRGFRKCSQPSVHDVTPVHLVSPESAFGLDRENRETNRSQCAVSIFVSKSLCKMISANSIHLQSVYLCSNVKEMLWQRNSIDKQEIECFHGVRKFSYILCLLPLTHRLMSHDSFETGENLKKPLFQK